MTFKPKYDLRSPEIGELLQLLVHHEVEFVIAGSVAALLHGVDLCPGDLDIVPELSAANLKRLIAVLEAIEGHPPGPFGAWTVLPNGEKKWIARETTPEELAAWAPDPGDIDSLDHLYVTRLGNFDVVPEINGEFAFLQERAVRLPAYGHTPWVAHIDDLLWRNTVPRREKDIPRIAALREIQRSRALTGRSSGKDH